MAKKIKHKKNIRKPSTQKEKNTRFAKKPAQEDIKPVVSLYSAAEKKWVYAIILVCCFIIYGNTLQNKYALDDAIVITQNDITRAGVSGIDEILSTELFSGFFGKKKNLVAGGRYRPLSVITFAIEWEFFSSGYVLTELSHDLIDDSYDLLKKKRVPPDIIRELRALKNKNYESREAFEKAIENTIGEPDAIKHSDTIFTASRSAFGNPLVSHLLNIILFAITCMLLFTILCRLFAGFPLKKWYLSVPFIATMIYLVHPLHTEVISNIKGRDEIFTLMGALITLYYSIKYLDTNKKKYLLYSLCAYFFALASKENAITFFAIIPLAIFFFTDHKISRNLTTLLPMLGATIVYFSIRQSILGFESGSIPQELMNESFLHHNGMEKFLSIAYSLGLYIKLLFVPTNLTFDYYPYQIPIINIGHSLSWLAILSILINAGLFLYALGNLFKSYGRFAKGEDKKTSPIAFGILFYFATFSIVSNIPFSIGTLASERFMYIPSIGFAVIIAYFLVETLPKLIGNSMLQRAAFGVLTLVLVLYSAKTISRNSDWQNDYTLFTADVLVSENSAKSNCSAGGKLIEEAEDLRKLIAKEYTDISEIEEELMETNLRRSEISQLLEAGSVNDVIDNIKGKIESSFRQAIGYLEKTVTEIHPTYADALLLLGNAHFQYNKDIDKAMIYYKRILNQNPNYDRVFTNTEIILAGIDSVAKKISIYEELYAINPNRYDVNYRLGLLYGENQIDNDKSIAYLERAIAVNPNSFEAYKGLGAAYGVKQDYQKSINVTEKAIQINPQDKQLKINLGLTYNLLGIQEFNVNKQYQKALEAFMKASNYIQQDYTVFANIGQCYLLLGNQEKANEFFLKANQVKAGQ